MTGILPTKQQLSFLDWEMGAFFHFGIRTFHEGHQDWDGKPMDLSAFCPTELDCDSWIRTIKKAGMTYAILVCKHHDGFANWPSKYTDYSVANTPWKDGRGDVVREFVNACRKYDIRVGLYYSPAEAGYQKRSPKEHDDYFIDQISELLTNYGKIDYLWFDGCGSEGHEYDRKRIIHAIRSLQPEILIFNMWDPDTKWVGNEAGVADRRNSNVVSAVDFSVLAKVQEDLDTKRFLPTECDFRMRSRNWFYSEYDVHTVKSVEELVSLYYYSVGNGANFLVNIGPDRRGLLPGVDSERLLEFGQEIRRRFSQPVPATWESTEDGICIRLEEEQFINHVILQEDLTAGENIQAFRVSVRSGLIQHPVCVHIGATIGHKRIIVFPAIRATEVRVKVTDAKGTFHFLSPQVFYIRY